jgi:hypothetical protein
MSDFIDKDKLYEEYVNWCLNLNIKPISFDEFKNENN